MLRELAEWIRDLKGFETTQIGTKTYSDKKLIAVEPPVYHTEEKKLSSLDALVQLVATEAHNYDNVYIHVKDPLTVEAFTDTDERKERDAICRVEYGGKAFKEDPMEIPGALLQLQGLCEPGEDRDYLLEAMKNMTVEKGEDYSSSSKKTLTEVMSAYGDTLKKKVKLKPTRTFPEVEQPESLFYLSVGEIEVPTWTVNATAQAINCCGYVPTPSPVIPPKKAIFASIVCADGGRWQQTAMDSVKTYLRKRVGECDVDNVLVI